MNSTLRQLAIGVAGGLIVVLIMAIWGWISGGGLVHVLGGLTVSGLDEQLEKVHTQITEANQKTVSIFNEELEKIRTQTTEANQRTRSVEIGPGEAKDLDTPYQATSAGFVTATAETGGAGRCILYGYAAADSRSLNSPRNPRYLRAVSSLQYAPGGTVHGRPTENVHPYLPLSSFAFPVRKGEFWTVIGCDQYHEEFKAQQKTSIKFYALELYEGGNDALD